MEVSKEQMSIMQYIASGNPGAVTVIGEFMYYDNRELILSELKRKNIIGSEVWVIYKRCNKNIKEFIKEILK